MQGPSATQVGVSLALEAHRRGLVDDARLQAILDYYGRGSPTTGPGFDPPHVVLTRLGGLAEHQVSFIVEAARRPAAASKDAAGRPFGPRLTLHESLGEGGMGTVYRAHDRVLKRAVAVKVMKLDPAHDEAERALRLRRFEREAQLMARLRHPTIVAVWDAGISDEGDPYLVMELVAGKSLSSLIREQGALDPRKVTAWGRALAEGLAACHAAGVVHRDLKPANILIDTSGQARLTDFGVARDEQAATRLTAEHQSVGTLAYMAPEQLGGEECDGRTDLHALGATLHEALTGQRLFTAPYPALLRQILQDRPPSVRAARPEVPAALDEVVLRCLEKERAARFASGEELAAALAAVERGEVAPAKAPAPASAPLPSTAPRPRRRRERGPWATIAVAAAAAAAGAGGVAALRSRPGQGPAPPEASTGAPPHSAAATAPAPTAPTEAAPTEAAPPAPSASPSPLTIRGAEATNERDGSELVWIPPGTAWIGDNMDQSEPRARQVRVERGYYIGKYEVSWAQYKRWRVATGQPVRPAVLGFHGLTAEVHDDDPASFFSYADALAYCEWAGLRLPTDVEWEYAARGPEGHTWPWGREFSARSPRVANILDATLLAALSEELQRESAPHIKFPYDDGAVGPWPRGSAPAGVSPFGCHDMAGNVAEWTSGVAAVDPAIPWTRKAHNGRGGRCQDTYWTARAACIGRYPDEAELGLRVARDPDL